MGGNFVPPPPPPPPPPPSPQILNTLDPPSPWILYVLCPNHPPFFMEQPSPTDDQLSKATASLCVVNTVK